MPKKWLTSAARPYLSDYMLHFVHSAHRDYITFTESWKPIQIRCRNIRSEKLCNGDPGIKSHMQCKWGFAIQMSQNNIFSCDSAKKVTHLCCQAFSDWSYASFCTLTSSILHNFYKILETDSNPMQKYKIWKAMQWGSRHKKSYAVQMRFCNTNESKLYIFLWFCQKSDSFVLPGLFWLIICFILYSHLIDIT